MYRGTVGLRLMYMTRCNDVAAAKATAMVASSRNQAPIDTGLPQTCDA